MPSVIAALAEYVMNMSVVIDTKGRYLQCIVNKRRAVDVS